MRRAEAVPIKVIARHVRCSKNTVKAALATRWPRTSAEGVAGQAERCRGNTIWVMPDTRRKTWCFRIRVNLDARSPIPKEEEMVVVVDDGSQTVSIGPRGSDRQVLVLRGSGYFTFEEARRQGERWSDALLVAFIDTGIGADFGSRTASGSFSPQFLEQISAKAGVQAINDEVGLKVFPCEPPAQFLAIRAQASVVLGANRLADSLRKAATQGAAAAPDQAQVAYDIWSASMSVTGHSARLLVLMTGVETLMTQEARRAEVVAHVDGLMGETKDCDLTREEVDSLIGGLSRMKWDSIKSAGRRLADELEPKRYRGLSPGKFFSECYDMRSRVTHGRVPLPDRAEISAHATALEKLLRDLLRGRVGLPPV